MKTKQIVRIIKEKRNAFKIDVFLLGSIFLIEYTDHVSLTSPRHAGLKIIHRNR